MEVSTIYSICRVEEKSTEQTLLHCPRTNLIWRMTNGQLWGAISGLWLPPFLNAIHQTIVESPPRGSRVTYVTYQIWLSRNSFMFDAEIVRIW